MRVSHPRLTLQQRHDFVARVDSSNELARVHQDVVYPTSSDAPLQSLPVYFDGLRCKWSSGGPSACTYVCRTLRLMREHCKQEHGWVNQQKRGGDVRAKELHSANRIWIQDRACQRFFKVASWQKYFEVAACNPGTDFEHMTNQKQLFFQAQKEDVKKTVSDLAEAANIVQGFDSHRSTVVPWLRETGIVKHIAQLKKDEIKAAIALPSLDGESELRKVVDAMESLLREAHGLCFDGTECMLTWPCRVVLSRFQSSQVDVVGKTRAFDPYKEPGTLKSYFGISQRFLSYFHRVVFPDEYYFNTEETDEQAERPEDVIKATDEQLAAWDDILQIAKRECQSEDDEERKLTELKDRLLEMWLLVIGHNTGARRYQSPLLSFCAMLSIKPSTKGWLEPGNFNSHLSAMVWVVQLLVFYDSARKEQQGRGQTLQLVKRYCGRYLQQTVETPMGEILRWRLLLFKISKESMGDHEASWDESEQVLTYEDTELNMDEIPTLLASEYQDCHRLLYEDLMMNQKTTGHMHSWALKDGPNVDTIDWNFTQHRDNVHLLKGADTALLSAIDRSEQLSHLFLSADTRAPNGFVWRETALAAYEATVQQFLQRLCVLIHVSGGQPVRESEFFEMTWRNTQRRRSISIRHDRVMVHVKFHKGQQQTGRYKENVRFLAHPVGELLLDYIVYVMPLRQTFLRHHTPRRLLSPFLWEKDGKVWPESQLSRCLEEASTRACIPRLHVANWRQITVAIVKTKFASQVACFEADDEDEDAEEMDQAIQIMTRQRNHKTRTVNRAYANQTGSGFSNLWDGQVRMGLKASTLWQDFWGVETIMKSKKRARVGDGPRLAKRIAMGIYRPRKPWPADALLEAVKKLYKKQEIDWKSADQERALTTIMSSTEQVVVILPTGAGKSLLFMLPCTLPDAGITILVVPLVALRGDLLRRLGGLRVDHIEWTPGEKRECGLVLVTAEAASTRDFSKYARSLISQQKLDRIVIDECHLTITAAGYRQSIVDLVAIRSLRTQFVYLTATLPPSMQTEFEERNHLLRPKVIRASSNRPNIFYMVCRTTSGQGSLLEQAAARARDAWDRPGMFDQSRDKIILYVRTRDEANDLAKLLDCSMYTARSGTATEKEATVAEWVQSPAQPYIVATTAFAEGFDYPYVRLVVNVNEPESMVTFAQESGRAGRDGERAYSLVLIPSSWEASGNRDTMQTLPATHDISLGKQRERQAMHRYLECQQCFRTSLSEYLDSPEHRRWCMADDVPCDICRQGHEEPVEPVEEDQAYTNTTNFTGEALIHEARKKEYLELARYREDLLMVRGTCLLCRATGERWDHDLQSCYRRAEVFNEKKRAIDRHQSKGQRWLRQYTACFWCLNPQSICHRADRETNKQGDRCEDPDVVLPLCYGIFLASAGARWLSEKFDRRFEDAESYLDWLGEECLFGGGKAIQAVRVAAEALIEFHLY